MTGPSRAALDDLFRRESGHLVAALTRLLGPARLSLAEDVVQDALLAAMEAWRFELPRDPKAWLLETAKNQAIDRLRREQRTSRLEPGLGDHVTLLAELNGALEPSRDGANQLAMMFSICDDGVSRETHVTLILRWLGGLSPAEIGRAFLVDTATIDRRLHRGRATLAERGALEDITDPTRVQARQESVIQALYLLFNEGYHGSHAENPLHPAMCADALRLAELLLEAPISMKAEVHALAALFCFNAARLPGRLDGEGIYLPLSEQDRSKWDFGLVSRGLRHLVAAAAGTRISRWHVEAGIALEHVKAKTVEQTDWAQIVRLYDGLLELLPTPIVALNRALAIAEARGLAEGLALLRPLIEDDRLEKYPFFWAALADLEQRSGDLTSAVPHFQRAIAVSRNEAEREALRRRLESLAH